MKNISVVILAAGFGTRMKSSLPKVLQKISGLPMLYYSIKEAKKLSNDVKVVLFHKAELVKEEMGKYFEDIEYILQDVERYPGTGGALRGIEYKYDKVLILNGDMPLIRSSELEKFLSLEADIVMSHITLNDPSGYGRVVIAEDEVKKIVEEKDASEAEKGIKEVNAGVYLIKKEVLDHYIPLLSNKNNSREYYLTDVIFLANDDGKSVRSIEVSEDNFKGVNSKKDLAEAEEIMQERIKDALMKNGVSIRLPKSVYIESLVEVEGECHIENGVSLLGKTKIKNSHIKSNTIVEDSTIIDSQIGPLARIRPKCYIKDTHIGNFTEVKNSTLNGVKAGHLSYLGDSTIDEGTNVGAGTITCNYDGKKKYQTKIGKNVFIGSDTQIVAPVVIEDDVIIAAGTTLTKDVKKGSLAISRSPLKTIENFFYKFFN